MLFIIGLGLFDEKDVTVRGKELIDKAEFVYLESYTAILLCQKDKLEQFYGKEIIEADRNFVESQCDEMLERAQKADVAFLVVGDPFCATTHADLFLRAKEKGVTVRVVHNASVMSAVAACGLQLYRFGETVSLVFFEKGWRPESFYDKLKKNADSGLHSLCLLDIKVKEQTVENMMKGNKIFEPPRFMSVNVAVEQLLEIEEKRGEGVCTPTTKAFGVARLGSEDAQIVAGTLEELKTVDFGRPLHSLVLCAPSLHEMEEEFFHLFHASAGTS
uniref:diphthine methyl ester synthase n=1 Tax=Chromera velia CCMP2878 TaxID=1169474 RepID=A0A0G4FV72_9ALVE|mmetsp:Transcript_17190/g.34846  ORF Transcript_17190/g.34846 Transcript_17190/m.34846 type:complete len:274 (+) Transcript_17190:208-1029(+)|eukprot:Cvel_472.t1-p1 / transcript=Cvel_472.t1 / gene=Cvel_472 / organism=Chromera_velia_CCMP2878 / gene_product=Diphthine synthase, putative / transcript_product=Diphthine synthase, putative / location=Cvel_scaffold15:34639-39031(-) / protein_length=273 / sequence_SO=supercontig / SO=protein_coding / is_pseudo=false